MTYQKLEYGPTKRARRPQSLTEAIVAAFRDHPLVRIAIIAALALTIFYSARHSRFSSFSLPPDEHDHSARYGSPMQRFMNSKDGKPPFMAAAPTAAPGARVSPVDELTVEREPARDAEEGEQRSSDDNNNTEPMLSGFRRTPERFNPKFDGFAVSLKSGVDVVHERSLIQLMSFLQPIRNLMLIGDGVVEVGDLEMVDVVTDLYEKDEAKKLEKRNLVAAKPKAHKERKVSHKASDSVQVDESSQGWKSDSHKNLPGFRELWNRFPDADWYVMLDDDTYVFFDNLADRLSIYDPEHKHYFGAKTQFVGCDNIWQWGQGPYFAHGGSGIVLSRGALRELVEGVDVCIERYKTCWAGDVRTALCLRDQGILLHSPSGFHGSPPNKDFWFPHNPCDRPMTFHHLLVKQIQDLYNLERRMISQHGKGSVAFGDIYWDWHAGSELQTNYDRRGADVAQLPANTTQACQALCASKKICTTFVFDGKMCWMKDRIPPGSPEKGMTTGIVKSRYTCGGSSRGGFR